MHGSNVSCAGLAVLALAAVTGGCSGGNADTPQTLSTATVSSRSTFQGLTFTATSRAEYRAGEPIAVTFTVRNNTAETITYVPAACQYLTRTLVASGPAGYLSQPHYSTTSPSDLGAVVADVQPDSGLEQERTNDRCTDSVSLPPGPTLTTSLAPGEEKTFTFTWDQRANGYSDYDAYPALPFPQSDYTSGEFVRPGVYSLTPQLRLVQLNGQLLHPVDASTDRFPTLVPQKLGPDPLTVSILR